MNREERRALNRAAKARAASYPERLTPLPESEWPSSSKRLATQQTPPTAVWVSRRWIVQLYQIPEELGDGVVGRVSVRRTDGKAEVTWYELQEIKREIGFGDRWALEIFPDDASLTDVANMRHLWLLAAPPAFGWKKGG